MFAEQELEHIAEVLAHGGKGFGKAFGGLFVDFGNDLQKLGLGVDEVLDAG